MIWKLQLLKAANGSAKQELETTFEENIGSKNFDIIVTDGDLGGDEKPDPKTISYSITKNEFEAFGITNSWKFISSRRFSKKSTLIQEASTKSNTEHDINQVIASNIETALI